MWEEESTGKAGIKRHSFTPLHSDMARTIILLLSLVSGHVTMVTALEKSCHRMIHLELIRELGNRTKQLLQILPMEERSHKRARLLPKFCTKCRERKRDGALKAVREFTFLLRWTGELLHQRVL
uniref:Uncharacterized protein n=1 Tax=Knipowitschia caucasica TaxID=637954 RepID=A0AAV2IVR5_KNICA